MFSVPAMYDYVIHRLQYELPKELYYHNHEHTRHIVTMVEEIGRHEQCSENEIRLLQIAGLWHDSGYLHVYLGHEMEGCELARKYLPDYGIGADEIEIICGMIMATRVPQQPNNKLEEIIADADLEYLGTANAPDIAELLFQELKHRKPEMSRQEWHEMQLKFVGGHHYFTGFCKAYREPQKQQYLRLLEQQTVQI